MAIEILKRHFDLGVSYVETVSAFYSNCNTRGHYKTRESLIRAVADLDEYARLFSETLSKAAKSGDGGGALSAKAISGLNGHSKKLRKLLEAILLGLRNQTINSPTALRKDALPAVRDLLLESVTYLKKYVPSDAQPEDLEKDLINYAVKGVTANTKNILQNAAKLMTTGDKDLSAEEIQARETDKQAANLLSGYKKLSSKLPHTLGGKAFTLVELPIVPYADFTLLTPKFLRTTGLDFDYLAESFVVINKQYLLAFDYVAATTDSSGTRKSATLKKASSTLNARKRTAQHTSLQEEFVIGVLDIINKKAGEEYTLMSSHFEHHPNNGRIAFAWIVPKRIQRMFARQGDLSNAEWGFPWNRKSVSTL